MTVPLPQSWRWLSLHGLKAAAKTSTRAGIRAIDLTTIRLEKRAIGAEAAQLLLRRVDDPDAPVTTKILPTKLIVRGTTAMAGPG